MISATNGKTTTAAMAASILQRAGLRLVHNRAGANMAGGIASTLAAAARPRGAIAGQLGLFEVDEFWLDRVGAQLHPRAILLGNLFRDQLDRYGELETIADRWAAMVAGLPAGAQLALNADDPLIADLGRDRAGVTYFGVEDRSMARAEMQHASDSKHCRRCGAAYVYDGDLPRPSRASIAARAAASTAPSPTRRRRERDVCTAPAPPPSRCARRPGAPPWRLPLPGPVQRLQRARRGRAVPGAGRDAGRRSPTGCEHVSAAFGRAERIAVGEHELSVLLIKNPAGANEILRTLALEPGELDLLGVLNDRTADGRDVSWIWDADFELLAGQVRRVTCAGTRAAELALRLKYAGVPADRLAVVPELAAALDRTVREAPAGAALFALPTYTALLELRAELARRGHVGRFYETAEAVRPVSEAIWHDLECGSYGEDLALWRRLADAQPGAVLDVGAGTGRTTLPLARAGHAVLALDLDDALLEVLRERAGRPCRCGRSSATPARSGWARSSGCASCRCRRSSCSAARAVAHRSWSARACTWRPAACWRWRWPTSWSASRWCPAGRGRCPTWREIDGVVYCSRPTAVRRDGDGFELERRARR